MFEATQRLLCESHIIHADILECPLIDSSQGMECILAFLAQETDWRDMLLERSLNVAGASLKMLDRNDLTTLRIGRTGIGIKIQAAQTSTRHEDSG